MRFYHLSPETILGLPRWQVEILIAELGAVQAEEQLQALDVESVVWAKEGDRRGFVSRLQKLIRRGVVHQPPRQRPDVVVYDPRKATEWLRARGIEVIGPDGP